LIYPGRRAVLIAAGMAPLSLLIALLAPAYWYAGLAALALLIALTAVDGLLASQSRTMEVICKGPGAVSVGADFEVPVSVRFGDTAPAHAELALGASPIAMPRSGTRRPLEIAAGAGNATFDYQAKRRGTANIGPVWLRWQGPFGLLWRQRIFRLDQPVVITPDIRPVREKAVQLLNKDYQFGQSVQQHVGEGAEFEALAEFRPGMDKRRIDWKQSARHSMLLAKEYRTERNNNIFMAVDAGRVMSEPLAGVPRIDRAISAALLTAWVALREGDRVGFFGFDSHPRVASNAVGGERSFALLQRVAAGIDYSSRETNYTLALATLAEQLQRRSLIVIFTEFADTISAEYMIQAVGRLLGRHLVLFVVMRDEELENFVMAEPQTPADVTRSVTAATLLRERQLVIARLRRLGVHVLEAEHGSAGPALVNTFMGLKRRSLL
jgi:uncharacterized protein (DUF58 family)